MTPYTFPSGPLQTNAYLVVFGPVGVVIDPAPTSYDTIVPFAHTHHITLTGVIITHSHWDHMADATRFQALGLPIMVHEADVPNIRAPGADLLPCPLVIPALEPTHFLIDNERIEIGTGALRVLHTPGHSPGAICLYSEEYKCLFSGDTLFKRSMGAISFPTSQPERMWTSLKRLALLPADTVVYPGHGQPTTIAKEYWLDKAEEYFG